MRKLILGTAAVAVAVTSGAVANDLTLGGGPVTTASITSDLFFFDPTGNITVTGVTETADSSVTACGLTPNDLQIGRATGYENMNGLALSSGYLEDLDADSAGGSGFGCFGAEGGTGIGCTGIDPVLSDAISLAESGVLGAGPGTADAAIVEVMFTAAVATTLDLSYSFMTMETPTDPSFYDSFGIIYDGALLAGGRSNAAAPASTDPWVLTPGTAGEFQTVAAAFWTVPAHETGIRTLTIPVSAGAHTLSFHVADGGPDIDCGLGPAPFQTACDIAPSVLIVGPHTFWSGVPGTVTGGPEISRIGHPAPAGAFPDDLQVTLSGAGAYSPTFIIVGAPPISPTVGTTFPLISPLELYVSPLLILSGPLTDGAGGAVAPAGPIVVSPGDVGSTVFVQWFGVDLSGSPTIFNTKAMQIDFGL